ncbi:MAG: hypothetical protein P9X24_19800 [Candidatus Hatepunaea meridiana]|nr:hypothetical protein [Candidatus Hatepunaea meridiana]
MAVYLIDYIAANAEHDINLKIYQTLIPLGELTIGVTIPNHSWLIDCSLTESEIWITIKDLLDPNDNILITEITLKRSGRLLNHFEQWLKRHLQP